VILELGEEWWVKFTTSANLELLIRSLNKTNFDTHIELEYLATLTTIISKMLSLSNLNDLDLDVPPTLFNKILNLLRNFLNNLN
jgi:hypothetical protein